MEYGFRLEWYDLDEDLREQKIDAYIEYGYNNSEYTNDEGEHDRTLEEVLEDSEIRSNAERSISARFPMYF